MNLRDQLDEVNQFKRKLKMDQINDPGLVVDDIVNIEDVDEMETEELEDLIIQISAYLSWLNYQKGILESKIRLLENRYKRKIGIATLRLGEKFKWKTSDEKIAYVLENNSKISKMYERLTVLQSELDSIKNMPFAISKHMENIKLKLYSRNGSGS